MIQSRRQKEKRIRVINEGRGERETEETEKKIKSR